MEPTIKPIETVYAGYRFRSRLEARWAVFFDTAGIRWEYEKEGFELSDGTRYLPDFWLPEYQCWIEIKGQQPTDAEWHKAGLLAVQTGKWVDIFTPEPWATMNIYAFRSRMPQLLWPRGLEYVELAMSCGDWDVADAIVRSNDWIYWGDVGRRIEEARQITWRHDYGKPYRALASLRLELCRKCGRLLFGHKEEIVTMTQWAGVLLGTDRRSYSLVSNWAKEDPVQVIEIEVPEVFEPRPDWCPKCDDEEAFGDPTHPRLIAAYTAARQARFEHGERGRRS